ncbi:MAG: aldo/keto reductase, partial [Verrucomicrobiota bacterium]
NTGLSIPRLVFGTTPLGNLFVALPDEAKTEIVDQWFEQMPGTVFLDSAGKYGAGMALEVVGRELKGREDRVLLSNKLGWRRVPMEGGIPSFEPEAWKELTHDAVQDISYEGILRCWEEGDRLLGGIRQDLVSVHDPDDYLAAAESEAEREERKEHIREAYRALFELKADGKVTAVGVGAKDWTSVRDIMKEQPLDWVMLANSLTVYQHPPELLAFVEELHQRGVGVINAAPFQGGFLLGGDFFDYQPVSGLSQKEVLLAWRSRFHQICEEHELPPVLVCVQFAMSFPGIHAVALGSSKPERVKEQVEMTTASASIPTEFWQALADAGLISSELPFFL